MPISQSAKKALRVSRYKTSVNRRRKALVKDALKTLGSPEEISKATSYIDKAAKWKLIHPRKAARLKSRLSKQAAASETGTVKAKPTRAKKVVAKKATKTIAKSKKP